MTSETMTRLRTIAARAILFVALLGPTAAGESTARAAGGRALDELTAALDLDSKTRAEVARVVSASRDEAARKRQDIARRRQELRALLAEDEPDEQAVMARVDELAAAMRDAWKQRLRVLLEVRGLLTPAQRRILSERRGTGAAGACRDDVVRLCPEAVGRRDAIRCLRTHADELDEACRAMLRARSTGRFLGHAPDGRNDG
jgi:Spy/CpxP family protein refolding chaperone